MRKARQLHWKDIRVGMKASFTVRLTEEMLQQFLQLSGDFNPLHSDERYASKTAFVHRVIPGMMLAGFFSRLVGMYIPGKNSLYVSQLISFRKPAFISDTIRVEGQVVRVIASTKMIVLKTIIVNAKTAQVLISGEGRALFV